MTNIKSTLRYDVVIKGRETIIVEEADRAAIKLAKDNKIKTISLKGNDFDTSLITGVFIHKDEVSDNSDVWKKTNEEWHQECVKLSKRSKTDKITDEITTRILPGLNLAKITLDDTQMKVLELNIKTYFDLFPNAPRCPSRIWFPIIADYTLPSNKKGANLLMGKWWMLVAQNDNAILEWMKYNKNVVSQKSKK